MLPKSKRDSFLKAFGAGRVAEIEKALEEKAKQADDAGLEKKSRQPALPPRLAGSFTAWRYDLHQKAEALRKEQQAKTAPARPQPGKRLVDLLMADPRVAELHRRIKEVAR